jgi:molybdate transport system substrate-binding protein
MTLNTRAPLRTLTATLFALSFFGLARAAEIKVVTVGGLQKGIAPIAEAFKKETGHDIKFNFTNPANLQKTLASEGPFDVIVVATQPVADLAKAGKVLPASQAKVVRGGIAVSMKEGAARPDVSTPEALKAAMLAAKSIVYTDPATPNGSGEKTRAILQKIGVWDAVVAKGKMEGLGPGKEAVAKGVYELGLFNASEAEAPGCVVAGLVPQSLQEYTTYDAGVFADATQKEAGSAFVKFLTGAAAGERWKAARMEPAGM